MVACLTHDAKMFMPMDQLVDLEKERQRLEKELTKSRKNLEGIEKKLSNQGFLSKAPENVVSAEKEKAEKLRALIAQLEESYQKLCK
jgi:valyl-tRNA synthetase